MLNDGFATLVATIVSVISYAGYIGIASLMAIESACVPLPSDHLTLRRLPRLHGSLQLSLGCNGRRCRVQSRIYGCLFCGGARRESASRALGIVPSYQCQRIRSCAAILCEIWSDNRLHRPAASGGSDLYRAAGRIGPHACLEVSGLYFHRVMDLVLSARLCRHPTRRTLEQRSDDEVYLPPIRYRDPGCVHERGYLVCVAAREIARTVLRLTG
jgi:hypothetical protein